MAGLEDVLGAGDAAKQLFLWSVLNNVISALIQPYLTALESKVNSDHPVLPISPADAAHAVVRSYMTDGDGQAEAAKSGVAAGAFAVLKDLAGDAPAPQQLVEALRRGIIARDGAGAGSTSFVQGIAETNLLNKWTPVVEALATQWPTPATAADATLKGQVGLAEGKALYEKFGGDPQWFDLIYNSAGAAPTPLEAVDMAIRGIIPWDGTGAGAVSYEQAFLEGPWRNKWAPAYRAAAYPVPTASEAIGFLRYGIIDQGQAAAYLAKRGITGEQAAAWLAYAQVNAVDDYRGLTEQAVLAMVAAGYTSDDQARVMLKAVHKGDAAIDQLLRYADMQRAIAQLANAINRIGNLYQGRKIGPDTARQALLSLHLPAASVNPIIADWDAVANVNVKTLTAAQIVDAWEVGILDQAGAVTELGSIGYTPFDAWVLLSVKAKKPLPDRPASGPGTPLGAPHPGTT